MAKNQDEFVVTGSGIKLAKDMVDQKSVAPQTDAQRHVRKWLGGVVGRGGWFMVVVVVLTFVVLNSSSVVVVLLLLGAVLLLFQARNCGS